MRDMPPTPLFSWAARIETARATAARRRLRRYAIAIAGGCAGLMLPALVSPTPRLVWNATPSSPTGLYLVLPGKDAARGDVVIAWLPEPARRLANERRYVPASVPVVKHIAGARGDEVCGRGDWLAVNRAIVARRLAADRRGRPLPRWEGCHLLAADEVLLLADASESFDGRYFGPVSRSLLVGRARLIWAW